MSSPFRKLVLAAIAKHDGQWGLRQLERALGPIHPDLASDLRGILDTLQQDRLVTVDSRSAGPQARYALTAKGRTELG